VVGATGYLAAAVFLGALATIASERVHRTKVALVGAAVIALFGFLDVEEAVAAVDWETLGVLIGIMILVGLTERTGVFTYVALRVAQLSKGRPLHLIFLLAGATGILSAFLDNLTAILLVVPVTLLLSDMLRIPAIRHAVESERSEQERLGRKVMTRLGDKARDPTPPRGKRA